MRVSPEGAALSGPQSDKVELSAVSPDSAGARACNVRLPGEPKRSSQRSWSHSRPPGAGPTLRMSRSTNESHNGSKVKVFIPFAFILALLAAGVQADPIQDGALASYRAGWFANDGPRPLELLGHLQGEGARQPRRVRGGRRAGTVQAGFGCRVAGKPKGDLATWLYGSQLDDRPACYTTGIDLKGSFNQELLSASAS